jgi:hypothetical protein
MTQVGKVGELVLPRTSCLIDVSLEVCWREILVLKNYTYFLSEFENVCSKFRPANAFPFRMNTQPEISSHLEQDVVSTDRFQTAMS